MKVYIKYSARDAINTNKYTDDFKMTLQVNTVIIFLVTVVAPVAILLGVGWIFYS